MMCALFMCVRTNVYIIRLLKCHQKNQKKRNRATEGTLPLCLRLCVWVCVCVRGCAVAPKHGGLCYVAFSLMNLVFVRSSGVFLYMDWKIVTN